MTDLLWNRLAVLVPEALDRPSTERDAFLDAACRLLDGTLDTELRAEAAALIEASEEADAAGALVSPAVRRRSGEDVPDERVGPWRLAGRLGEGGMGVVYRAERADGAYARTVALKRLHPSLGAALAGRFDAERRTLARLEHEGIARFYEGGVDAHGAPYLVMELVEGQSLTAYADAQDLGVRARVALFVQVCDAVAYAHQNLIVHRDLKPSNVFVAGTGEAARVKLLDFGIARLLDEEAAALETRTAAALTPSYAAPEQLTRGAVTTATDVYALGVLLFELLTGQRPYALAGLSAAEAERLVCDVLPPLASSVASPGRARALRGDLDTIVAKALAKEPARRYASAEAFADDLRRALDGRPVQARPPRAGYRVGRFVRRHRGSVVATVLVVLALVTGTLVALSQARTARAEAARATAMNNFLVGLLAAPDPTAAQGRDVRVASLLDHAAATLDSAFAGQPDVEGALRHTLGVTYQELGLTDEAEREFRRALVLRERPRGSRPHDVIETQNALGTLWLLDNRLEAADSILTRALASARSALGARDALIGTTLSNLGYVRFLRGDLDASLAMHRASVEIEQAQPTPDPVEVASGLGNVAVVLQNLGRSAEAAGIQEEQVAVYRAAFGGANPRLARALDNLSTTYYALGRYRDALRASTEAVAVYRRSQGDPVELARALSNEAPVLLKLDRPVEAEAVLREALGLYEASVGTQHPRYATALVKLGQTQQAQGQNAAAEASLRQALGLLRANVAATHPVLGHGLVALGTLLAETGRASEAVPLLREALTVRRAALPDGHPDRAVAASLLGDALRRTGDVAGAESLLVASSTALARAAATDSALAGVAAEASARLAALRAAARR